MVKSISGYLDILLPTFPVNPAKTKNTCLISPLISVKRGVSNGCMENLDINKITGINSILIINI